MKKIRQKIISVVVGKFGPRSLFFILVPTIGALGCGWSLLTEHSVRFTAYRSGRGFYRLPPLPIMYEPKTGKEITVQDLYDSYDYYEDVGRSEADISDAEEAESEDSKTWDEARMAVQSNDLANAKLLLEKFLELTKIPQSGEPDHERRNSARDMLDALAALKHGSKSEPVKTYLDARYAAYHNNGENLDELLGLASADRNLQDNWAYLRAALLVREKNPDEALIAFKDHSTKYASSEKHEAVLYMIAKLTMEASHSFGNTACDVDEKDVSGEAIDKSGLEPIETCRDANWLQAIEGFRLLMRQYPTGRYFFGVIRFKQVEGIKIRIIFFFQFTYQRFKYCTFISVSKSPASQCGITGANYI